MLRIYKHTGAPAEIKPDAGIYNTHRNQEVQHGLEMREARRRQRRCTIGLRRRSTRRRVGRQWRSGRRRRRRKRWRFRAGGDRGGCEVRLRARLLPRPLLRAAQGAFAGGLRRDGLGAGGLRARQLRRPRIPQLRLFSLPPLPWFIICLMFKINRHFLRRAGHE